MNSVKNLNPRLSARIVGVLYIIVTAAPILTAPFLGFLGGAITGGEPTPDYLANVSVNENQIIIGALIELMWALAVVGIPVFARARLGESSRGIHTADGHSVSNRNSLPGSGARAL